ncbi:hypothetical protein BKA56DRAFT_651545 [Ilyonectria sp. MPI-CAGE-AT-0026]|nr:hypothetical protein BKA56DRAFT_651545 [Ilyonectria sp. MPI-CAGE-AT-0026]
MVTSMVPIRVSDKIKCRCSYHEPDTSSSELELHILLMMATCCGTYSRDQHDEGMLVNRTKRQHQNSSIAYPGQSTRDAAETRFNFGRCALGPHKFIQKPRKLASNDYRFITSVLDGGLRKLLGYGKITIVSPEIELHGRNMDGAGWSDLTWAGACSEPGYGLTQSRRNKPTLNIR